MPHHHHPHHGHHPHPHSPHPADPLIEVLRKLARHDRIADIGELIECVRRLKRDDVASMLIEVDKAFGSPPVDLAIDSLETKLRLMAHQRKQQFFSSAATKRVALVFPLPPHVHEDWIAVPGVQILLPTGHPLPPHLHGERVSTIEGTRHCRRAIGSFEIVLVEGFRANGEFLGDLEAVDIVDRMLICAQASVQIHLRPHLHHEDVPFNMDHDRFEIL